MNTYEVLEKRLSRLERALQNEESRRVDELSLFGFGDKTKTHQKMVDTIIAAIKKYAPSYVTDSKNFKIETKPSKSGFTVDISPVPDGRFWRADERPYIHIIGSSTMKTGKSKGFAIDYELYSGSSADNKPLKNLSTDRKAFDLDDVKKAAISIGDFIADWSKRHQFESLQRRYRARKIV